MATIKDVAAAAGVSYTTVSHVINGTRVVAPETKERVERAIRELGFCPNRAAKALRTGDAATVSVVAMSGSDPYFSGVIHGIQERAWNEGTDVFVAYSELTDACPKVWNPDVYAEICARERDHIDRSLRHLAKGVIINSLQEDEELEACLNGLSIPAILFQRLLPGSSWDTYISDDYGGTMEAMDHLLGLGHRRIGLVEGFSFDSHTVKHRKRAWRNALTMAGLDCGDELIRDGRYDQQGALDATVDLLSLEARPTAILYYSDEMALAGLRAARDMGLSVPEDVSIVGYDNLCLCDYTCPRLTSVNQMRVTIGIEMMERLLERIANPNLQPIIKTYPERLVIRESTGPAQNG